MYLWIIVSVKCKIVSIVGGKCNQYAAVFTALRFEGTYVQNALILKLICLKTALFPKVLVHEHLVDQIQEKVK